MYTQIHNIVNMNVHMCTRQHLVAAKNCYGMACSSRLLKLQVSFAKEPYERDDILQKRPVILRSLLVVATP